MGFMKKGLRDDSRKQIKKIQTASQNYIKNFYKYSEVAYKLSTLKEEVNNENLDSILEKHSFEPLDEMGRFLVLGEYGRIKNQNG